MTDDQTPEEGTAELLSKYGVDPDSPLNQIHRAMWAARHDLPAIEKKGELTLGSNTVQFTKIEDIRRALYPVLDKHGIMAYIDIVDSNEILQVAEEPRTAAMFRDVKDDEGRLLYKELILPRDEIRDGRIPTTRMWAWVIMRITFVSVVDNSSVFATAKGSAYDTNSDKATGKATTAAIKRILGETFNVIDPTEGDPDYENMGDEGDGRNRPVTTDRATGQAPTGDRGAQQRAAAAAGGRRPTQQRSISTSPAKALSQAATAAAETGADAETGVVPDDRPPAQDAPEESRLDAAKARVRAANEILGKTPAEVDAIALAETGSKTRQGENGWLTKVTFVEKVATHLEKLVADGGEPAQFSKEAAK
jgi:hypothetical protein